MKNWLTAIGLVLVFSIVLIGAAYAQGDIKVVSSDAQPTFAKDITFRLVAESSSPITEISVLYRDALEAATNRAYPKFTPGKHVEAEYSWELLPGELPVGANIRYYWLIKDADGHELKTQPQFVQYNDDRFTWKEKSAGKVQMYYYAADDQRADELLKVATAALDRIGTQIGVRPQQPIKIYVYNSKDDMSDALVSRSTTYDAFTTTLGVVVAKDTLLLLGSAAGVEQTAAHELTHIVVGEATSNPFHAPIPRWLDEGLAMYNEGSLPDYNRRALQQAIADDKLISVRSLSAYTGDPGLVDLFYGESYSIVKYILDTYGRDKMVQLLGVFRRGAYQEDALQEVFGFGLDQLDAKWRQSVGAKPRQPEPAAPGSTEA